MSNKKYIQSGSGNQTRTTTLKKDQPAVGIRVSRGTSGDAVAGAILRARRHDHQMFVANTESIDNEATEFAQKLGATVIDVGWAKTDGASTRDIVASTSRESGFPGVIWQGHPEDQVDFRKSREVLRTSSKYIIEAERKPAVDADIDVIVAIPAFNEESTIGDAVEEAQNHADDVLVVDDGSDDETAARAYECGASIIEHETNRGYGAALKTAFREADCIGTDILITMDGDGQHDPSDIPRLIKSQRESNANIVIGSRFEGKPETNIPIYRRFGLSVVNLLTNLSFGVVRPKARVQDTQSGFRAYNREAITSLFHDANIHDHMGASTDILHHAIANGLEITEVGTSIRYDVENGSTQKPIQHGITIVLNLLQTIERDRPISFLGVPGLISSLIGIGFGYWTIINLFRNGVFPLGLALMSSFFLLAGIFAAFTAIILHSLKTKPSMVSRTYGRRGTIDRDRKVRRNQT